MMTPQRAVWLSAPAAPLDRMICEALLADDRVRRVVCVYGEQDAFGAGQLARVQCERADFSSYRSLRGLLSSQALRDVDTVVHAIEAGSKLATTAESTRLLLHLSEEQASIKRFVLRSFATLYRLDSREPALIDEQHALDLTHVPAQFQPCAEADFTVCERIGSSRLQLTVLRCAEVLSPLERGPLYGYLSSRVCLRPLGYDPMLNVLSPEDLVQAIGRAAHGDAAGVFNIPGFDTLPLSELIYSAGRIALPIPGPALAPLYALRKLLTQREFQYASDQARFHHGAVLDGSKARHLLGYVPAQPVRFDQLFAR